MKKGSKGDRLTVYSLLAILASAFFLLFFFVQFPVAGITGNFVRYGTGPYIYNCSSCSDCNEAILNASSGDVIYMNTAVSASGICINITEKTGITFDCMNNYITGSGYGIMLLYSNTSEVRNCGISVSNGIYSYASSNNVIRNIVTAGSSGSGITFYYTSNTALTNIFSMSDIYGIYLSSSSGNTFTNVNIDGSQYGITLVTSNNNSVYNSNITNSIYFGINSSDSSYNFFQNVNLKNDATGIFLVGSSYNTMKNSHIERNTYGLFFDLSYNNLFYNNFFNNTNNYYAYNTTCLTGNFNTSKTLGSNIIGKSYIGGNFWAKIGGYGFSQNCTLDADEDKICDIPYNISCTTFDYLPLIYQPVGAVIDCNELWTCSSWSSCINGNKTRTCSDYNLCGTNNTRPILTQNCTANQTVITPANQTLNNTGALGTEGIGTKITQNITVVTPIAPAVITINDAQIYLTKITLNVKESIESASVTITKVNVLSNATLAMGLPSGQFYQAFRVDTSGVNSSNIANVTIEFKVNKAWLTGKNGTSSTVRLYRRLDTSSQWNNLATSLTDQDSQYYYFTSVSPGFSTFAIFFRPCQGSECGTAEGISTGTILLYVVIGLVGAGIILTSFFLFKKLKRKQ